MIIAITGDNNVGKDTLAYMIHLCINNPNLTYVQWLGRNLNARLRNEYRDHCVLELKSHLVTTIVAFTGLPRYLIDSQKGKSGYWSTYDLKFYAAESVIGCNKEINVINTIDELLMHQNDTTQKFINIRVLYQFFGDSVGRELFTDSLSAKLLVSRIQDHPKIYLLPDLRLKTDVDILKEVDDVVVIKMTRPTVTPVGDRNHSSVTGLSAVEYDYSVVNDTDLASLLDNARTIALELISIYKIDTDISSSRDELLSRSYFSKYYQRTIKYAL